MASAITHAVAALTITTWFYRRETPRVVWITAVAASIVPDFDTLGAAAGIPYGSMFGHRGITHSLLFAALFAWLLARVALNQATGMSPRRLWLYFFLVVASHGFLDAFTNGGRGIAFFAPFTAHRYFFPWQPIEVSPLSVTGFFNQRGLTILASEARWVWIPAALIAAAGILWNRRRTETELERTRI